MPNKLMFSLLMQISAIVKMDNINIAQGLLLKEFGRILEADVCAVYLKKEARPGYHLLWQHDVSGGYAFADFWMEDEYNSSFNFSYIKKSEQMSAFFLKTSKIDFKRYLLLPLIMENRIAGIFLAAWEKTFPLDSMLPEELETFSLISQLIADLYCIRPHVNYLKQREEDLSILYCKAVQDLEDSRKQVSLELHDEVGQVLTSILLQLKLLEKSADLEYVKGRLGGLHHITLQALEEVRRISQNLRPTLLEKLGLGASIESHIKDFIDATGIRVEFRSNDIGTGISSEIETVVYRGVQEGLTNVARHAQASKVIVSLTRKGQRLFLQIADDGVGMKENQGTGTGLLGMRERVKMVGGRFWTGDHGQGLVVNILLPLTAKRR
ncbi:MAG: sensor histidine kinase [Bacillota bacterium]